MVFILGLLIGAALVALAVWLQRVGVVVKWYSWLLGCLGFVLALLAFNEFFTSMAEHDERAGRVLLLIVGIPGLILLGLAVFLVWWHWHRKATRLNSVAQEQT